MNSRENHEPMSDPFDVWLQSCPAADVPEGLRARCLATIPESQQTEDAVRAAPTAEAAASPATTPDTVRLHERKSTMFRIARYSSIAAAAVVVGVVAGYFLLVHPTASVTFAQVIENVTKAESISFMFRQKIGSQPVMVSRMWMQRDKVRMDLVGVEMSADLTGPQAEGVRKLRELGEGGKLPALLTMIGDTSRQEGIELDHFRKTAVKKKMDARAAADIPQNLVEKFRNVKGDDAELVGEEQRDGRKVLAYRLTKLDLPSFTARKEPGDQMEMTVWVDAKTGLPVRIRIEGALSATRDDHSFFDWDEFAWNQPLDPGLFSLEVPEGYAVKDLPPLPAPEETAKPGSREMIKGEIEKARAAREAAIEREGKAPQD
jgi:outer membrane lipoprotein-sorting protein